VIHRDIKPKSLLDAGRDQVGDFGIGRVFDASTIEDTLTQEQRAGGHAGVHMSRSRRWKQGLDGRTGVYGLGCVLARIWRASRLPGPDAAGSRRTAPRIDSVAPAAAGCRR
jgi:hypothetical protein